MAQWQMDRFRQKVLKKPNNLFTPLHHKANKSLFGQDLKTNIKVEIRALELSEDNSYTLSLQELIVLKMMAKWSLFGFVILSRLIAAVAKKVLILFQDLQAVSSVSLSVQTIIESSVVVTPSYLTMYTSTSQTQTRYPFLYFRAFLYLMVNNIFIFIPLDRT